MKKHFSLRSLTLSLIALTLLAVIVIITTTNSKAAPTLATKLSGRILLQVEDHGKAWYVSPDNNNQRIYLGSPQKAFYLMKTLGLGISNNDLNKYLDNKFPTRLAGKILLAVEQHGEAYYINPLDLKAHYLGRPIDAFNIMRQLALGITTANLNTIGVLSDSKMLEKYNIPIDSENNNDDQTNSETNITSHNISLVTQEVAPMTNFSQIVSVSATIANPNNITIKEKGLLYDFTTSPNISLAPTIEKHNQKIVSEFSSLNNTYTLNITNLKPGSYPFIRAYLITEDKQIVYGNTITIKSISDNNLPYLPVSSPTFSSPAVPVIPVYNICGDELYDNRDGNIYKTVAIGEQCWFQENLKETKYSDGTPIPNLESNEDWSAATSGAYVWYDNQAAYEANGALYNVMAAIDSKGLCPSGWHVPTKIEFEELGEYLVEDLGKKMKAISWDGSNTSGFSALPTGARIDEEDEGNYIFSYLNDATVFLTISESNEGGDVSFFAAALFGKGMSDKEFKILDFDKWWGASVRCLKNDNKTLTYTFGTDGSIIGSSTQIVSYNEDGTAVEALPNDGYRFVQWSDGVTANPRTDKNVIDNIAVEAQFTIIVCPSSTVYYEGYDYKTVEIGDQCWFQENLNIGNRIDGDNNQTNNFSIEKYCYDNLETNCDIYGGFYQWNEMMNYNTSTTQGICPAGWHVPTDGEWSALITYLGEENPGPKLRASSTDPIPNWDGDNSSGFTALPAGYFGSGGGGFQYFGEAAGLWSSTESPPSNSWNRNLSSGYSEFENTDNSRANGYSVRCLRD